MQSQILHGGALLPVSSVKQRTIGWLHVYHSAAIVDIASRRRRIVTHAPEEEKTFAVFTTLNSISGSRVLMTSIFYKNMIVFEDCMRRHVVGT